VGSCISGLVRTIVQVAAWLDLSGRGLGKLCPRRIGFPFLHGHRACETPLPDVAAKEQIVFETKETR